MYSLKENPNQILVKGKVRFRPKHGIDYVVEKNERALVAQYNVGEWNLVDPSKREGGLEVDVKGGIRTPLNQQHREIRQKKEKKTKMIQFW